MIEVKIIVKENGNEVERTYRGDYHELYNKDWDDRTQDMLNNFEPDDNDS